MRQIGTIDTESQARIFRAYLLTRDIHSDLDQRKDKRWAVWVHEETRLDEARQELERFLANPKDPVYMEAASSGLELERQKQREEAEYQKLQTDLRLKWHMSQSGSSVLTLVLIMISVGVFVLQNFPQTRETVNSLLSIQAFQVHDGYITFSKRALNEVRQGQVWRLITPIFLHFSFLHILFNMLWLRMLGGAVETVLGTWKLAGFVLAFAIVSNFVQYYGWGPRFGGMSGVVYGLFAYTWLVGRAENEPRYYIDSFNVGLMLFWLVASMVGIIPNVANGAHVAGLLMGAAAAGIRLKGKFKF